MLRETFAVGPLGCNCTILACPETREAVVVDPGGDYPRIHEVLEHFDLTVTAIVHTHAHLDHIYCTRELAEAHGGEIWLHRDDHLLYKSLPVQCMMFGFAPRRTRPVDRFFADGDRVEFGARSALVLHTPGHTPGSVCFEVADGASTLVFAGDTLFRRGIGRTDLPGGDSRKLVESIRTRLYTLAPDARVIPGHGPETTIEEEAARNPFVRA